MVRSILAVLLSSFAMFSLAGLFTGVIARSFIEQHVDRAMLRVPPNLLLTYAGYLLLAALMTIAFRQLYRPGRKPAVLGVKIGLATAVAWLMPYSLVLFSVYRFPYAALPIDFAWALVEEGTGGLIIGLVHAWGARGTGRAAANR